jgi:2-methylcitrate dehydratase PrpD
VTVKLYPSCAATHPPLDALIEMKRREGLTSDQIESVDVDVDSMTPRLLIHPNPTNGLEAKFSMPFCAAAALVYPHVGIDTFDVDRIHNPAIQSLMPRVSLRANDAFDNAAPLSQARVTVHLRDGRVLSQSADGARGYPGRLTDEELATKFLACAVRTLTPSAVGSAWGVLTSFGQIADIRDLTALLSVQ